jgi:hypothetical protein
MAKPSRIPELPNHLWLPAGPSKKALQVGRSFSRGGADEPLRRGPGRVSPPRAFPLRRWSDSKARTGLKHGWATSSPWS